MRLKTLRECSCRCGNVTVFGEQLENREERLLLIGIVGDGVSEIPVSLGDRRAGTATAMRLGIECSNFSSQVMG